MSEESAPGRSRLQRELILFGILLAASLLLLPPAIYAVGILIFGEYGGSGFGAFLADLGGRLSSLEPATLFLLLAPYLVWQSVRLAICALRR